ncbi:MAG: hypothetical protein K2L16_00505 [Muribaculaceae bacterium]|nr:hypothetical protein [Muribaculaceae bacterium]
MDSRNNKSAFWPSYVDIMTTLFAIMLVLFAVSYSRFKVQRLEMERLEMERARLEIYRDEYERIQSIYRAVDNIDPEYFEFNERYLKHIFRIQVTYQKEKFNLESLVQDDSRSVEYNPTEANAIRQRIKDAGEEIRRTILNLQLNDSLRNSIKYLVVIEGQASADGWAQDDYRNNNVLSYLRAVKLHEFWRDEAGIDFSDMEKCELVISGSGERGVPRAERISTEDDSRNQRFLIHIVPVIGNIHLNSSL